MSWLSDFGDYVGITGDEAPTDDGWESSEGWDYDFKGKPAEYSSFLDDYEDGTLDSDWGDYEGASGGGSEKSFLDSFKSPGVLAAMIQSGSGLLAGMSNLDVQKQAIAAAKEKEKMNQMLELAKLKHSLMGKGGSGGRRSGGGGSSVDPRTAINAQYSANQVSGYNSVGNNLANIYRS